MTRPAAVFGVIALGATLAMAWFLIVNLACSWLAARLACRRTPAAPAWWFTLRILPALAASLFVGAVFLPSYWRYEPRQTAEEFDLTLTACAIAAAVLIGRGGVRGIAAWRRASCRTRAWLGSARPIAIAGAAVPAFSIDADYPLMALVGILRPRLLVTRGLMHALSDEELAACVAHELGHSQAWDNLKRLAMRASPDLLSGTATAREIERRWASLASALVKVARLMPERITVEPISTLIAGGEIAARVRRLLEDRALAPAATRRRRVRAASLVFGVALCAAYGPLLHAVHHVTEILVGSLP